MITYKAMAATLGDVMETDLYNRLIPVRRATASDSEMCAQIEAMIGRQAYLEVESLINTMICEWQAVGFWMGLNLAGLLCEEPEL